MTGNIVKKIGFSLLVWGLLMASSSAAMAQTFGNGGSTRPYTDSDRARDFGTYTKNSGRVSIGGATAAAEERYNNAGGGLKGVGNAIWGAGKDIINFATGNSDKAGRDLSNETSRKALEGFAKGDDALKRATSGSDVYVDPSGNSYVLDKNGNAVDGIMEGCIPIQLKLAQLQKCIFCPLFKVLYETARAMAVASFETLAKAFKTLLLIGFALYIAYITLRQVSAFTKQDAPKYITESLTMAFKVFFAWLLLVNGPEIYRLGLEPLLSAGLEMGSEFMQHQAAGSSVDVTGCGGSISGTNTTFYSDSLYSKIDCFLKKVTQEIAVSQSIGSSLMCVARHKASNWMGMWDLTMFMTGLIVWAMAWLICLAFAFYLIDTVIRLGVIGAILPFLIAAWPFGITRGYTQTGWKMFLNAFFTFVFLGLVISVNVELSAQAATGGNGGTDDIIGLMNANDIDGLMERMSIGLSGLIFLLVCCFFGFKLTGQAAQLASEISQAKSPDLGSKIGSVAAGAAKGATKRTVGTLVGAAKVVGEALPSVGAITSIVDDHGSFAGDFRAIGDTVASVPGRINRAIYNNFTPAGRRLKNARAGGGETEQQNALPENEAQNVLQGDQNSLPNNQAQNNVQNQANEANRTNAYDNMNQGAEQSGSRAPVTVANAPQSTGSAEEQSIAAAQNAAPREDGDSTIAAMAAANGIVSQAKSEMASQAQNSANSVDTEKSKREEEARAHAAPTPQPGTQKKEPPVFGGKDGTPSRPEATENAAPTAPAEGVAPATREEVAQAKHDLAEGKQLSPDTVASIVSAQSVVSKDIREEMKRMVENAAANGVERKDIAAVSYVIAEMKGEHVAEKKNASSVHEYRKGIDDETLRRAEEQLRAAQAKAASEPAKSPDAKSGPSVGSGGNGTSGTQSAETPQANSDDSGRSGGMIRGQYNDTIGREKSGDKDNDGKQQNQRDLDAAKQEAALLNQAIDGYKKRIEELQKKLGASGNSVAAAEIKRLKEELDRLERSRK